MNPMKEAFQVAVGNGDPDEAESNYTSLFDLMTTPPSMDSSEDFMSIDFAISDRTRCPLMDEWNPKNNVYGDPDTIVTGNYGTLTVLKGFSINSADSLRQPRYSASKCDGICVDTCLLYTSPSPRDQRGSRMPSSA